MTVYAQLAAGLASRRSGRRFSQVMTLGVTALLLTPRVAMTRDMVAQRKGLALSTLTTRQVDTQVCLYPVRFEAAA